MTALSADKLERISMLVGNTPIHAMSKGNLKLLMKMETKNLTGSLKDRSALQVILDGVKSREIHSGTTIIESSSGNFAISMATMCKSLGLRFVPVIDPNIQRASRSFLEASCEDVILVSEIDEIGGYQRNRIDRVKLEVGRNKNYYWPNQYSNPSCMLAHYQHTGGEIIEQAPAIDFAFIGVSSGGTLAGLSKRLKEHYRDIKIIAVDAEGSFIFPGKRSRRFISGLGSTSRPGLLQYAVIDGYIKVTDAETIDGCLELWENHGLFAGGSTGGVYSAVKKYFAQHEREAHGKPTNVVFLCADSGHAYLDTIYSGTWRNWYSEQDLELKELEPAPRLAVGSP